MAARSVIPALFALTIASPALAATTPPGVNLRWDKCYDDGGVMNRAFACNSNAGSERLVMSFVLSAPLAQVSGTEINLELKASTQTLPEWWMLNNVGVCRQSSLSITGALPAGSVNCSDWANGEATVSIVDYQIGYFGFNTVRLWSVGAVPQTQLADLVAGAEYSAGSLIIDHAKTGGSGACTGCSVPACLVFGYLRLSTPVNPTTLVLANGANGPASQVATWQGAEPTGLEIVCGFQACVKIMTDCVLGRTPVRANRWGEVKALYR